MNTRIFIISAALLTAAPMASDAASIAINFGAGRAAGSLAAGVSAGVVSQTNWNNAAGASGTLATLTNDSGAASGASLAWQSDEEWSIGTPSAESGGNGILFNGWISANSITSTASLILTGIPFASYNVYVYTNHDRVTEDVLLNGPFGAFNLQENDTNVTEATAITFVRQTTTASGDAAQMGNYALFTGLSGANLTIGFTAGGAPAGAADRGPITGIQIVGVPEPSTGLMVLGAALGAFKRRRPTR